MNPRAQQGGPAGPIKARFRAVAIALALVTTLLGLPQTVAQATNTQATNTQATNTAVTLFGNARPAEPSKGSGRAVEVGLRFVPRVDGVVTGIRFYKGSGNKGKHTASLWTSSGRRLAKATFSKETAKGWQSVRFAHPVSVTAGRRYVVSYHAPHGHYAATTGAFKKTSKRGDLTVPANGGVRRYGSSKFPKSGKATNYFVDVDFRPLKATTTTPVPTTTAPTTPAPTTTVSPSVAGFPGVGSTGVPAGVTLKPYAGPSRITAPGTVIDGALITTPLVIVAGANNVTIRNSVIRASAFFLVLNDEGATNLRIIDSELDGQGNASGDSAVAGANYTLTRVNIHGTVDGVKLGDNVTIEDSFIHDLAMFNDSHNDGMQSLGSDNVVIRHNTVIVAGGATSAIMLSTGSASSMKNIVIDANLLGGGAFTVYGGYQKGVDVLSRVSGIVISNNRITTSVHPLGGAYGPFASVDAPAVTLTGNTWYDGSKAGKAI